MARLRTLILLDHLLAGNVLTAEQLTSFLAERVEEDEHLEFKSGLVLAKKAEASAFVRQYVSAFANSGGGALFLGVADKTWVVEGCVPPGGGTLSEWVSRTLSPLVPHLYPIPRWFEVDHPGGKVVVIATERSPRLVSSVWNGAAAYFLRIGDQTVQAPEYLIADLFLGRRQHPSLVLGLWMSAQGSSDRDGPLCVLRDITLRVTNTSIVWADDVVMGVLGWCVGKEAAPIPHALLHMIDALKPRSAEAHAHVHPARFPRANEAPAVALRPLETVDCSLDSTITVRASNTIMTVKMAAYVFARNMPPCWFQVTVQVGPLLDHCPHVTSEPLWRDRPVVAWEYAD